jgi:truncated hemoglobin YjbI
MRIGRNIMTPDAELTEKRLAALVERFYGRVRQDKLIGPVFNGAIGDWPQHLQKLAHFWSSVMLATGRYKGNPVAEHLKHIDQITPEMFERWLTLWRETTVEFLPPEAASQLQAKADRHKPDRSTPVFDQDSLPTALRREHRTKAGTWGVIRILEGELKLHFVDSPEVQQLSPDRPGIVEPGQTHWVEPLGVMRMRVDFYDGPPAV